MARYINSADLCNVVMKNKTEYGRLATLIDNIVEEMVRQTPTADVVERSKIDKAIEELEQHRELSHADFEQYTEENGLSDCEDYHFAGLRTALEILKKYIGEVREVTI